MAHGAPDFHQYRKDSASYPVADLAELAVRLGSPLVLDGRGDLAWWDSFEQGQGRWTITFNPTGGSSSISTTVTDHGNYSLDLRTAGSGANQAQILRTVPRRTVSLIGYEVHWAPVGELSTFLMRVETFDGSRHRRYQVRFDLPNSKIEYNDATGWHDLATGISIPDGLSGFNYSKLVVGADGTDDYVRLRFNRFAYDLSAFTSVDVASTTAEQYRYTILVTGTTGAVAQCNIDLVAVSWSEPAEP